MEESLKLQQAYEDLKEALAQCIEAITKAVQAMIKEIAETFSKCFNHLLSNLSQWVDCAVTSRRVVYLAKHHKKARVRKKNQNRINRKRRKLIHGYTF